MFSFILMRSIRRYSTAPRTVLVYQITSQIRKGVCEKNPKKGDRLPAGAPLAVLAAGTAALHMGSRHLGGLLGQETGVSPVASPPVLRELRLLCEKRFPIDILQLSHGHLSANCGVRYAFTDRHDQEDSQ